MFWVLTLEVSSEESHHSTVTPSVISTGTAVLFLVLELVFGFIPELALFRPIFRVDAHKAREEC